jgi:hypothetical protein
MILAFAGCFHAEIEVLPINPEGKALGSKETSAGVTFDQYLKKIKPTYPIFILSFESRKNFKTFRIYDDIYHVYDDIYNGEGKKYTIFGYGKASHNLLFLPNEATCIISHIYSYRILYKWLCQLQTQL